MSNVQAEFSEAEIAVHRREESLIAPPPKFVGQANRTGPAIFDRTSLKQLPECYREYGTYSIGAEAGRKGLLALERCFGSGLLAAKSMPLATVSIGKDVNHEQ